MTKGLASESFITGMGIARPLYAVMLLINVNYEIDNRWNALMATAVDALIPLAASLWDVKKKIINLHHDSTIQPHN